MNPTQDFITKKKTDPIESLKIKIVDVWIQTKITFVLHEIISNQLMK